LSAEIPLVLIASVLRLLRPSAIPVWLGPVVCLSVGLSATVVSASAVSSSLDLLQNSPLFLVFAVPLAVRLDEIGVVSAIAARCERGTHLVAGSWWLAGAP